MPDQSSITDHQIIRQFIGDSRKLLIDSQSSKGLTASGKSAEGIKESYQSETGQLIDTLGYFYFQEYGREPGKPPPYQKIFDWVGLRKYGITFESLKQQQSIAWAILTKIRREGTYTHTHGQTNVVTDILTPERITALTKTFASKYQADVASDIIKNLKEIK